MIEVLSKAISWLSATHKSYCPLCEKTDAGFSPLSDYYRDNAATHGFSYFGKGEMTALETYSCSNCGASDRERLYAYWIGLQLKANKLSSQSRIIHFAPEAILSSKLKTQKLDTYHTADLMMEGCDYKAEMMDMPFEDESYDFFICSHVLEHVESDDKAISELYRITDKGGSGILMAPIILDLKKTIEDPTITDEAGRWRHFGQNDHVRLYAHDDYLAKVKGQGFTVRELGEKYFGRNVFAKLGLKRTSILYVVTK